MVSRLLRVAAAIAVSASTVIAAAPAHADPSDDPCRGLATLVCRLVPMAPDSEGDVDLTTNQPQVPASAAESLPPYDVCSNGCD
jgi:hypothetical protein